MAFVQTIEVEATDKVALRDHLAHWHGEQAGLAPGYLGPGSWPRRAAGPAVARLPAAAFRPVFAGFVRLGHDRADTATESVAHHWRPYAEHGGATAFVRQIRSLRTADTLAVADALATVRVPAQVVWGAADRFQKLRYGERLAADLGTPLVRLDTARHFVPEDHPEAVADAVAEVVAAAA